MFINTTIEIPVCYWTKTSSNTIEYKLSNNTTGTLSGSNFMSIQSRFGPDYIYSYIPAEAWK